MYAGVMYAEERRMSFCSDPPKSVWSNQRQFKRRRKRLSVQMEEGRLSLRLNVRKRRPSQIHLVEGPMIGSRTSDSGILDVRKAFLTTDAHDHARPFIFQTCGSDFSGHFVRKGDKWVRGTPHNTTSPSVPRSRSSGSEELVCFLGLDFRKTLFFWRTWRRTLALVYYSEAQYFNSRASDTFELARSNTAVSFVMK